MERKKVHHCRPDHSGDGSSPPDFTAYRDVVVAVDADGSCEELLAFAFDAAARRDTTLRAVHIHNLPYGTGPLAIPGLHAHTRASAEAALATQLRPWQEKYPLVPVRAAVVHARTAHEIVRHGEDASLLVVGRGPRRAGVGPHTGPVTHAVIHHVACPVTVVPHAS